MGQSKRLFCPHCGTVKKSENSGFIDRFGGLMVSPEPGMTICFPEYDFSEGIRNMRISTLRPRRASISIRSSIGFRLKIFT